MTDSGPGRSAREIAEGAEAAANVLERKSEYARRRAANFRQGAQGEVDTAGVLAELSAARLDRAPRPARTQRWQH